MFKEGKIDLELLYLLNEVFIYLPPLSQRKSDIGTYITTISNFFAQKEKKNIKISFAAYRALVSYSWLGNYIELVNVLRSIIVFCEKDTVEIADLPEYIVSASGEKIENPTKQNLSTLNDVLNYTERETIISAMARHNNAITKAAKDLGISRQNLQYRLKKLNL